MARNPIERFLSTAAIARRAGVVPRIVVRRFEMDARALDQAAAGGSVTVAGAQACDLVVGDVVLARGEVVESDGRHVFQVREVNDATR